MDVTDEDVKEAGRLCQLMKEDEDYYKANALRACLLINEKLKSRQINKEIRPIDILVSRALLVDYPREEKLLSETIIDYVFPSVDKKTVSHFTKLGTLRNILKENKFRLYSIYKNASDHEYMEFYRSLGLNGYASTNGLGKSYFDAHMQELFMASFTELKSGKQEKILWNRFGDGARGVRIDIDVKANVDDFRKIHYDWKSRLSLIKEVSDSLKKEIGVAFIFHQISKMGAFYLPTRYEIENEYRMLVKKDTDTYSFDCEIKKDGPYSYIEIPIGDKNPYYDVQIVGITAGENINWDEATKIEDEFNIQIRINDAQE